MPDSVAIANAVGSPGCSAGARLRRLMTHLSVQSGALGDSALLDDSLLLDDSPLLAELGRVIGLADAIQLHGLLKDQASARTEELTSEGVAAQLRDTVLSTRQDLLDTLAEACGDEGAESFLRWPNLDSAVSLDGLTPSQRLERFYARLQQTLQVRVQELRQRTRKQLRSVLPRLVELDTWLEQAMASHLEKGLAAIPRQLGRHCADVLADVNSASDSSEERGHDPERKPAQNPISWQSELRSVTCSLFIAEIDVRLEPVLGLVDAFEDNQRTD